MDGKIKILCSRCVLPFRAKAAEIKEGHQMQCPNCARIVTFGNETPDVGIRRAMTDARRLRNRMQAQLEADTARVKN